MKILVAEYVTGGGLWGAPVPLGLAEEGRRMRRTLVADLLSAEPDLEVWFLEDARLAEESVQSRCRGLRVDERTSFMARWREGLEGCRAVWIVAPESKGVLAALSAEAEAYGCHLLSQPTQAVRLATHKSATSARLAAHGLPVVPTLSVSEYCARRAMGTTPWSGPSVVKPDDGVGCEGARVIASGEALAEVADGFVIQPLLAGSPLSLSVLFRHGEARLLSINRQWVERRGDGFVFTGCRVNALGDPKGHWQALASAIARAVPELMGYAGVDLLATAKGVRLLEINPRLTTSYVGLHRALGINPAKHVLEAWRTAALPAAHVIAGEPVDILLESAHDD